MINVLRAAALLAQSQAHVERKAEWPDLLTGVLYCRFSCSCFFSCRRNCQTFCSAIMLPGVVPFFLENFDKSEEFQSSRVKVRQKAEFGKRVAFLLSGKVSIFNFPSNC